MSNYNNLKTTIDDNIKQNGVQSITGNILNLVLNQMVNTLGTGYMFAGVATTATNPGSPDAKVFYIANGKGTYTNFGGIEVTEDDVVVLYWDSSWHKVSTGIASQGKLSKLDGRLDNIAGLELGNEDFANGFWFNNSFTTSGNFGLIRSIRNKQKIVNSFKLSIQSESFEGLSVYAQLFTDNNEIVNNFVVKNSIDSDTIIIDNFPNLISAYDYLSPKYFTLSVQKIVSGTYVAFDANISLTSEGVNKDIQLLNTKINENISVIFGDSTLKLNGYLSQQNGSFIPNPTIGNTSDYIAVSKGDTINYSLSCYGATIVALYNLEKTFNSGLSIKSTTHDISTGSIVIPQGISFVRFCNYAKDNPLSKFEIVPKEPLKVTIDKLLNDNSAQNNLQSFLWGDRSFTNNAYINQNNGELVPYSTFRASNLIRVAEGDVVNYSLSCRGAAIVALYKTDGTYSKANSIIDTDGTIHTGALTIPAGIGYVRVCNYPTAQGSPVFEFSTTSLSARASNGGETIDGNYMIAESIHKPITFNGKNLVAFGDSITAGVSSPNLGNAGEDKYISTFCRLVGATLVTNYAVSGSCITDADGVTSSIYDRVLGYTGNADIIWIAGGTNDWNTGKPIGTYASTDVKTFYGALRAICEHLKTNHPNAVVIFVTPIPYTTTNQYSSIAPLDAYRSAIYEIATLYGYNVVNGKDLGMPFKSGDWGNSMCADSDGCHPTIDGHKLYGRNLTGKLL